MPTLVHFELPADDIERAKKFYKDNFGWEINNIPEMNYNVVHTTEVDEKFMPKKIGAINGGIMERGIVKSPVITINVKDIKRAIEDVKKSGGAFVKGPDQIGDMGLSAYVKDSEGNIIGLWQSLKE